MSILAPVLVLGRTYLSPDVQPRALAVALAVLFLASVPPLLVGARQILSSRYLNPFLYVWEGLVIACVAVWVVLDGGGSSPYAVFFFVLVGHAAHAFSPRATVIAGLSAVLLRLVLGLVDARESVIDTVLEVVVLALLATASTLMAQGLQGLKALVGRSRTLAEQAVLLADADEGAAGALERTLLQQLSDGALLHGGRVTIGSATTSVVVDARQLLASADARLYDTRRRDRFRG